MDRKVFLISLLAVGLAATISAGLYVRLGHHKGLSQETRQAKGDTAAHQSPESRIKPEIGQGQESIGPEKETVALGLSEEAGLSTESGSGTQKFSGSPADSQPAPPIALSSTESQTTQQKGRDAQTSGAKDTESNEVSETPSVVLPKPTEEEKRPPAIDKGTLAVVKRTVIRRSAIALSVENREPKDISERVSVRQGRVYCWVHVINGQGGRITVRWMRKGQKLWETHLPVGSNNWRTWAYITLRPDMTGPAQADILNEDGRLLQTLSFEITG